MIHGRITPDVEAHLPATPRRLERHPAAIPGLHDERAPPSRFTDEQVVEAILAHLAGRSLAELAQALGASQDAVRQWCEGTSRRRCLLEAERRWRRMVARGARPDAGR